MMVVVVTDIGIVIGYNIFLLVSSLLKIFEFLQILKVIVHQFTQA